MNEPSPELAELYGRVEKGIAYLTERDPEGAFHIWFESGIGPRDPKPAQPPEVVDRYAEYHAGRLTFKRLWAKMVVLERKEGIHAEAP